METLIRKSQLLNPPLAAAQRKLEQTILTTWDSFAGDNGAAGLSQLAASPLLNLQFDQLCQQIRDGGVADHEIQKCGTRLLHKFILAARAIEEARLPQDQFDEFKLLNPKQWRKCLNRIIDRLASETSYFHDTITAGALGISRSGKLSKQLKSIIIPVTNPLLTPFIKQPIFVSIAGVILHPGAIPSPIQIVTSLAQQGTLPASFSRLQETVAKLLTWPVTKRITSFAFSTLLSIALLPLQLIAKAVLFVPRIVGGWWLKKSKLPLFVDPTLAQCFSEFATCARNTSIRGKRSTFDQIVRNIDRTNPNIPIDRVKLGVKNLLTLKALGASNTEIGALINGARFSEKTANYPKLEREIARRCSVLKIDSATEIDQLLTLDDSIWRLTLAQARLAAITISREEITKSLQQAKKDLGLKPLRRDKTLLRPQNSSNRQ